MKAIAEPLGLVERPDWFWKHVPNCEDCWAEYKSQGGLRYVVRMAEMGSRKNVTLEFAPDAEPEIVEAIENLLAVSPENVTCHQASRYYFDMATCSLKGPFHMQQV